MLGICEVKQIRLGKARMWKVGLARLKHLDFVLQREYGTISALSSGFLLSDTNFLKGASSLLGNANSFVFFGIIAYFE